MLIQALTITEPPKHGKGMEARLLTPVKLEALADFSCISITVG